MKSTGIFFIGSLFVIAVFALIKWRGLLTAEEMSALLTGLGFVGVIAAFRHEREKSSDDEKAHRELIAAMALQTKAETAATLLEASTHRWAALFQRRGVPEGYSLPAEEQNTAWREAVQYRKELEEIRKLVNRESSTSPMATPPR